MYKLFAIFAVLVLLFIAPGCVQRTIHITSHPTGALVRLNDQEVGRTPVSVPFEFYGDYSVRLSKQGYQTLWTHKRTKEPLWELPGLDLIAEMVPGAKVDVKWSFELEKATPPSKVNTKDLLDRAEDMRSKTNTQPSQ